MYSETAEVGRFRMFPRTPGISTSAQRRRADAAVRFANSVQPLDDSAKVHLESVAVENSSSFVPSATHFTRFRCFPATAPTAPPVAAEEGTKPRVVYVHGAFDLYNPGDVAFLHAVRHKRLARSDHSLC